MTSKADKHTSDGKIFAILVVAFVLSVILGWVSKHPLSVFMVFAIAGSIALTISAKISIPAIPVPFTLQTLVVLISFIQYPGIPRIATYTDSIANIIIRDV